MQATPIAGEQGLPMVVVAAADGARFEAYLHGAHVTSWRCAGDEDDRLFVSAAAKFEDGMAIRGGIPVCFPQFADQGALPMHGLVRTVPWTLVHAGQASDGAAHARFRVDYAGAHPAWPYPFACEVDVRAQGARLAVSLVATNTGRDAFAFTAALHTYLRVSDARKAVLRGLSAAHYRDKVLSHDDDVEQSAQLAVDRPLDRVYRRVPDRVEVVDGVRTLAVRASGTTDTVVWNPGPQPALPPDLDAGEWREFLCVEAAVASAPIGIAPGASWTISQTLDAVAQ